MGLSSSLTRLTHTLTQPAKKLARRVGVGWQEVLLLPDERPQLRFRALPALAAAGLLALVATPASAHNVVVSTTPENGGVLTELPERFDVTTNDQLLVIGDSTNAFVMQIRDAAGLYYGDGCVTVEGVAAYTAAELGEAGDYTLAWQLVSADGHTISGEAGFTWQPGPDAELAQGWDTPPVCGEARPEPTPEPEPEASAEPTVEPTETASPEPADDGAETDLMPVLLTGGALVVVAAALTWLLVARRRGA